MSNGRDVIGDNDKSCGGDKCFYCGRNSMPRWNCDPRSSETGRMCSWCGWIEPKSNYEKWIESIKIGPFRLVD